MRLVSLAIRARAAALKRFRPACPRRLGRYALAICLALWPGGFSVFRAQITDTARAARAVAPEELLRQADEALKRNDYAAAARSLEAVIQNQPDSVPAWFDLAYAYTGLHRNEDAVKAYRRVETLSPDLFEAHLNLGLLLLGLNETLESLEELEVALKLKPQDTRARLYEARALVAAGRGAEAESRLRHLLEQHPDLAQAEFDLGELELNQTRFEDARSAFEKALSLDPRLSHAQLGIAQALEGLEKPVQAEDHLERYLAQEPGDIEVRHHLARLYLTAGQNDRALAHLQEIHDRRPDLPGLAAELGDVYALLNNFAESEKNYRQALMTRPNDPDLHRALGQTLMEEGKYQQAETEFRTALKGMAGSREALKGLSSSLYLQKRYAEAIPVLEALAGKPDTPTAVFFVLATCYDHLQRRAEALENYQRFLQLAHGQNPDQEWQARQRAKLLQRELRK